MNKKLFTKKVAFQRRGKVTDFGVSFRDRFLATTVEDGELLSITADKLIKLGTKILKEIEDFDQAINIIEGLEEE
jgi:hypothetical protein